MLQYTRALGYYWRIAILRMVSIEVPPFFSCPRLAVNHHNHPLSEALKKFGGPPLVRTTRVL